MGVRLHSSARSTTGLRRLRNEQCSDCPAFVHCPIAFGYSLQRQLEVEDFAGVDRAVQHKLDQLREITPNGRRAAMQVDVRVEQLLTFELNSVGHADVRDV